MERADARTLALQERSTALVAVHCNDPREDIVAERRRATFDAAQLKYLLNGGKDKVERRWARGGARMARESPTNEARRRRRRAPRCACGDDVARDVRLRARRPARRAARPSPAARLVHGWNQQCQIAAAQPRDKRFHSAALSALCIPQGPAGC